MAGGLTSEADTVWRTAHHAVEDDNVSGRNRLGVLQNICHSKRAAALDPHFSCKLQCIRLVSRNQFDDLSVICAGREQLRLNRANAPAYFQDSSAIEFVGRDTGQHLAFENVQPFLSILFESPPCSVWLEELLTNPSATAT